MREEQKGRENEINELRTGLRVGEREKCRMKGRIGDAGKEEEMQKSRR